MTKVTPGQINETTWSSVDASFPSTGEFTYTDTYTIDISALPVGAKVFVTGAFSGNGNGANSLARARVIYNGTSWAENANRDAYYFAANVSTIITKVSGQNTITIQRATTLTTNGNYAAYRIA